MTIIKNIFVKESDDVITVTISPPSQNDAGDFAVKFEIKSSQSIFPLINYAGRGPDGVLAYILAFRIIGAELFRLDQEFYGMRLAQFIDGRNSVDPYYGFLPLDAGHFLEYRHKVSTTP